MLIKLYSVASIIETTNNMVYAMYQDGRIDIDSGRDLSEMPDSWTSALDKYDKEIMKMYCKNINNL